MAIKTKTLLFDGVAVKNVNPWDFDDSRGWVNLSGDQETAGIDLLAQRVPWLYRARKDRSNNVSSMPWCIERGEAQEYTSDKWQYEKPRDLEFLKNPRKLLSQVEDSLIMAGKAYMGLEVNPSGYIQSIKYLNPTTIQEVYNTTEKPIEWQGVTYKPGELMHYTRTLRGQTFPCSRADMKAVNGMIQIVPVYDPDYTVEIGPGKQSDGLAAMTAAGVLFSYDSFVARYFDRGAIKASILSVEGGTKDEQDRLQHWWDDVVAGVKNAWSSIVIRGKGVTPVTIGEGMEGIKDNDLSTQRRQDISTALGIPESRLWSAAANMATRKEDEAAYFRGTILPECDLIAEAFNEQVFTKGHGLGGWMLEFKPEDLDVFQEDESQRAGSLNQLTTAGVPLLMAMDILGYDLSDEQWAELEALKEKDQPGPTPPQLAPFTSQDNQPAPPADVTAPVAEPAPPADTPPAMGPDEMASIRAMLKNWQRKALHAFKLTKSAAIPWETNLLPASQLEGIRESLAACETVEQIKGVFDGVEIQDAQAEQIDPLLVLAHELKLAREALSV